LASSARLNKRFLIEWSDHDAPTTVEWIFTARSGQTTFVSVTNAVQAKEFWRAALERLWNVPA
jgi:hypothetical protein